MPPSARTRSPQSFSPQILTLFSGTCRTLATTSSGTPRPHIITAAALQISSTLLASFRASPPLSRSALLRCFSTLVPAMLRRFSARHAIPLLFRDSRCRCAAGRCHSAALHVTAGPCSSFAHRFHAMPRSSKARLILGSHIFSHAAQPPAFPMQRSPRLVSAVPRLSFSKRFRSASPQGLRRAYPCCPFLLRVASQLLDAYAAHRLSTPSRRRSSAAPSLFQSPRTEAIPLRTVP